MRERMLCDQHLPLSAAENSLECATLPDDFEDEPQSGYESMLMLLSWARKGSGPLARVVRYQAVYYMLMGGSVTQETLGKEIGVKKATINQQVVNLRDFLTENLNPSTMTRIVEATGMRSNEARQTFSKVCKSNHLKRKALSDSTESPTTSTANSGKRSDLRAKVLEMARQPSSQQSSVASS